MNLSTVVAKLSKTVVLRLTREKMFMIEPTSVSDDGILWCEIVVSSFFGEYYYEGRIYILILVPDFLSHV